jgi:hypothetical protein
MTLLQSLNNIPYIGPVLIYVPGIVALAAFICPFVPAPTVASNGAYKFIYAVLQWAALNKGQAINLTDPVNKGVVAGPGALSNPQLAASVVPAGAPMSVPTLVPVAVVGDPPVKGPTP